MTDWRGPNASLIGQPGSRKALGTPALVLDLDRLDANIHSMAAHAESHGYQLRPPAKIHKSTAVARRQVNAGAVGVCCATLSEAEVLTLEHYLEVLRYKPGAMPGDGAGPGQGRGCVHYQPSAVLGCCPPGPRRRGRYQGADRGAARSPHPARRSPDPGHGQGRGLRRPRPHAVLVDARRLAAGAAARELKLPTVRADAARLAEIAVRERQTQLAYAAGILAAEIDDRTGRRRTRRIAEARFPRIKRLADFNPDAIPGIAATLATLAAGAWIDAGQPAVLLGDSGTGKNPPPHRRGRGRLRAGPPGPLRRHRPAGQRARRSRRPAAAVPRRGPLGPPGPAPARRARLRPARPPRRRTALPDHHRTRRPSLHRHRHEPAVQRMGNRVHRPPPLRGHRRPRHLHRPHPGNRHPVLPAPHQQDPQPQPSQPWNEGLTLTIDRTRVRALGVNCGLRSGPFMAAASRSQHDGGADGPHSPTAR